MQDNSLSDLVSWQWNYQFTNVKSSSIENPISVFPEGIIDQYPIKLLQLS